MNKTSNRHFGFEILSNDKESIIIKRVLVNGKPNKMQHQKEMALPKLKIHCFDESELLALQKVQTELLSEYNAIRKARNKSLFRLFLNYIQHGKHEKMSYNSYLIGKLNVSDEVTK